MSDEPGTDTQLASTRHSQGDHVREHTNVVLLSSQPGDAGCDRSDAVLAVTAPTRPC